MTKLASKLLHDPDPTVRRSSAEELRKYAQTSGGHSQVVSVLVQGLRDPHAGVQEAVVESLAAFSPRVVFPQVLPLLEESVSVRNLAVEVLQQFGAAGADCIAKVASHADPHVRKFVASILGESGSVEAGPVLVGLLGDEEVNVRIVAAEGLGKIHYQEAFDALMQAVSDPDAWVSMSAICALGALGDQRAVPYLTELLSASDPAKQSLAVEALGQIGDSKVLPELLDMLPFATIPLRHFLFVAIIHLLGKDLTMVRTPEIRGYLFDQMVSALHTRDGEVQKAAIQGIRMLGDSQATGALVACLSQCDPHEEVMHAAVLEALCEMGDEQELIAAVEHGEEHVALLCLEALGVRQARGAMPELQRLVRESENREIRHAALLALGKIGVTGENRAVLDALLDLTGSIRKEAARIVADSGMKAAEPVLWNRLDEEPYSDVVEEQVRALICLQDESCSTGLQRLLTHARASVREAALANWPDRNADEVWPLFRGCLQDARWQVRVKAVERLAAITTHDLLEDMLKATADEHPYVRQAAVSGLARLATERVWQTLCRLLQQDADLWVRVRAVEVSVYHHHPEIRAVLRRLLDDAPVPLQMAIAQTLGTLKDLEAKEVLMRACHSSDPDVVQMAEWALAQLGCMPVQLGAAI